MLVLPDLPYAYEALEPVISATTLRIHHGRHHARYVENVNAMIGRTRAPHDSIEQLIRHAALAGEAGLFNNAAQAWNHAFFWESMSPRPSAPSRELEALAKASFGGLSGLRTVFLNEAVGHFGSGWVWLALEQDRLKVISTHDAGTAATHTFAPLLVCDLWEHAYYLDHQNDRAGFVAAWWDRLANWDFAERQLRAARGEAAAWRYPQPVPAVPTA